MDRKEITDLFHNTTPDVEMFLTVCKTNEGEVLGLAHGEPFFLINMAAFALHLVANRSMTQTEEEVYAEVLKVARETYLSNDDEVYKAIFNTTKRGREYGELPKTKRGRKKKAVAMEKVRLYRGLRDAAQLTQDGLAEKLGVDRSTIAKWENGDALPRAAMLPKIASILGCSIDDLLCLNSGETARNTV